MAKAEREKSWEELGIENDFMFGKIRQNREWRHEYMTLLMRDQENWERGKAEGKAEGKFEILDYF